MIMSIKAAPVRKLPINFASIVKYYGTHSVSNGRRVNGFKLGLLLSRPNVVSIFFKSNLHLLSTDLLKYCKNDFNNSQ